MTIKIDKLGWPIAAFLAGAVALSAISGFQGPALKFATVDMLKVYNDSPLTTTNNDALDSAKKSRLAVLDFINRNPSMDPVEARKLAELSSKATPTPADKTEIDRLHASGEAATQKRNDLSTKSAPTDPDKIALADFGSKVTTNRGLLQTLSAQYDNELQNMAGDLRDKTLSRVREVVRNIGAKQGYTIVFDASSAPYAANDITDEATKALKK